MDSNASSARILVIIGKPDGVSDTVIVANLQRAARQYQSIVCVDVEYRTIKSIDVPENVFLIPDVANDVFTFKQRQPPPGGFPAYQALQTPTPYSSRVEFLRTTTAVIKFVCVNDIIVSDIFGLAALVKVDRFSNKEWLVGASSIEDAAFSDGVTVPDFIITTSAVSLKKWIASADADVMEALHDLILEGLCCLRSWTRAGYQVMKNSIQIPGFAAQTGGKWMSLIISAYGIMPGEPDKNHEQAFFESASFRKVVCEASVNALSWFFVRAYDMDKVVTEKLLRDSVEHEKGVEKTPLGFDVHKSEFMHPDHPMHEDMVAWNSYKTWDAIYDKYVTL